MNRRNTRRYLIAALIAIITHGSLFVIAYVNEMSFLNLVYFKKHTTEFYVETVNDEGAMGQKPVEQKPAVEEEKHNENTGASIRDTEVVKGITDTIPDRDTNLFADTVSGTDDFSDNGEILNSNGFGGYGEYGNFGIEGKMPRFQGKESEYFRLWFREKFNYPQNISEGYNERVKISFMIDRNGKIKNTRIDGCSNESVKKAILKVLFISPVWTPAEVKGIPREFSFEMYINFKKY
jgi:hypothetical protein